MCVAGDRDCGDDAAFVLSVCPTTVIPQADRAVVSVQMATENHGRTSPRTERMRAEEEAIRAEDPRGTQERLCRSSDEVRRLHRQRPRFPPLMSSSTSAFGDTDTRHRPAHKPHCRRLSLSHRKVHARATFLTPETVAFLSEQQQRAKETRPHDRDAATAFYLAKHQALKRTTATAKAFLPDYADRAEVDSTVLRHCPRLARQFPDLDTHAIVRTLIRARGGAEDQQEEAEFTAGPSPLATPRSHRNMPRPDNALVALCGQSPQERDACHNSRMESLLKRFMKSRQTKGRTHGRGLALPSNSHRFAPVRLSKEPRRRRSGAKPAGGEKSRDETAAIEKSHGLQEEEPADQDLDIDDTIDDEHPVDNQDHRKDEPQEHTPNGACEFVADEAEDEDCHEANGADDEARQLAEIEEVSSCTPDHDAPNRARLVCLG